MLRSRSAGSFFALTLSLFAAACGSGSPATQTAGGGSGAGATNTGTAGGSALGTTAGTTGASGATGTAGAGAVGTTGGTTGTSGATGAAGAGAVGTTGGTSGTSGAANGGAGGGGMAVGTAGGGGTANSGTAGAGTGGAINQSACSSGTAQAGDVTVSLSSLQQKISGFGVSSAWSGSYRNASDADYLWSTTKGAGLSLLRIRYGDGLAIAKSAATNGVTVWMTPWGTGTNGATGGTYTTNQNNPNGCKNVGNIPVLSNASGLAGALATWVQNAKTQGVPIYAVSAENEPDSCGINSTTSYSAAQMATWIDTLGPAMSAIGVKVMAPETQNWYGFPSYFNAIKADATAYAQVNIFASHRYGLGPDSNNADVVAANKALAADSSKEYWETEVDTGTASGDSTGDGIASALLLVKQMHTDLTVANLNAWHIWWVYNAGGNGGCLYDTTSNTWTKRLWVMGNYARFVRPGYMRVSTSGTVPSGVLLTAYKSPADGTVVVVAANTNTSATPVSLFVSGDAPCTVTPWVTSASDNLAAQSPITVTGARFSATLAAQSVTTFVGKP